MPLHSDLYYTTEAVNLYNILTQQEKKKDIRSYFRSHDVVTKGLRDDGNGNCYGIALLYIQHTV